MSPNAQGGLLTLTGSVAAIWPLFQMQWTLPISLTWVGGLLVAGTGLTLIGLASKHLRRFGGMFGTSLLTAFGGAGASALLWAVGGGLEVLLTPSFGILTRLGEMGVAVFTAIVVLLVLIRLLGRGGASPDDDDRELRE